MVQVSKAQEFSHYSQNSYVTRVYIFLWGFSMPSLIKNLAKPTVKFVSFKLLAF